MTLRASLPMYTRPELDSANAALWQAIRDQMWVQGLQAPDALDPNGFGYAFWEAPDLLLSQTCGYPYRTRLSDKVAFIGTPNYGLPDCPPGYYYSVFVVHAASPVETLADLTTFAFNARDSQSGFRGPLDYAAQRGVKLQPTLETGSHMASAKAVADGKSSVAAIDAITWRNMTTFDRFTNDLKVIARTRPVPGLPLITGQANRVDDIRAIVSNVLANMPADAAQLGITGLSDLGADDYSADRFRP